MDFCEYRAQQNDCSIIFVYKNMVGTIYQKIIFWFTSPLRLKRAQCLKSLVMQSPREACFMYNAVILVTHRTKVNWLKYQ